METVTRMAGEGAILRDLGETPCVLQKVFKNHVLHMVMFAA